MNDKAPTPDGPKNPIWPFLFTTLGLPATVVGFFKADVALWPLWQKGLLAVAWLGLIVVGALSTEVWKHLRQSWGKDLALWIDDTVRNLFSRYRRRYLEFLYYQNRDFDVKGLSTLGAYNLELEDVFVDLTIAARPVHATTTDPIRTVPAELAGRRQIWDFLSSEALAKEPLVLIGPPGSGKTTLLKEIALQLTRRHRKRPRIKGRLPILLFLREHGDAVRDDASYTLPQAVEKALEKKHAPAPPSGWVEKQLAAGRCLVLLDGLDEVAAAETRKKVVAWVEAQMKAYGRNQFFVSSRPHGYRSNPIAGVTVLEVQSFSLKQVRRFVSNWYRANEVRASGKVDPGVEMKAREGAEDLVRRLWTTQTLLALAVNPLLLTMIATVHRFRSSLPGRRVELSAEIC
jgi:energy-coupling factor transporter ATP-binding protein EcfA2